MAGGRVRLSALCLVAILGGCATIQGSPTRMPDSRNAIGRLDPYYAETLREYYESGGDQVQVRNRFIETRMAVIDAQYGTFKEGLHREGVATNFLVDTSVLGLNLAGTLTPAASTKGILAAVSGGLIGTRAAAEKNFYFEKTMPALLSQMEALRKTVRVEILRRMQLNAASYPLSQAEYDLQQYFAAGTIPGAILGITVVAVDAERAATEALAEEIRERLVREGFDVGQAAQDDERRILDGFIRQSDGSLDRSKVALVQTWMKDNNVSASILVFIDDERYSRERRDLVRHLRHRGLIQ